MSSENSREKLCLFVISEKYKNMNLLDTRNETQQHGVTSELNDIYFGFQIITNYVNINKDILLIIVHF